MPVLCSRPKLQREEVVSSMDRAVVCSRRNQSARRTTGGIKPQLSFFFTPVSYWGFPLGEPTQKPVAWNPKQSPEVSLQVPKQGGEWIWKGKQETFLTLSVKRYGILWSHAP